MNTTARKIISHFDGAAASYDEAASLQQQVAQRLVEKANIDNPQDFLDIGAGTGLLSQVLRQKYPSASITAIDPAPQMLRKAQHKIRDLSIIEGDALTIPENTHYDAIFSNMMLHWLPDPAATLWHWQKFLKSGGGLFASLLIEGSFKEWRSLCRAHDAEDGLWQMPPANFADELNLKTERQSIAVDYASAHEFLRKLKATGAATARMGHKPLSFAKLRKILASAPRPFTVTYEVLYIGNESPGRV